MNNLLWQRLHGGTTHFPIALLIAAATLDLAGYVFNRKPQSDELHVAAYYALLLGAAGSLLAVASGILVAGGETFGQGELALHHYFIWPAFSLLIGLATWRLVVRQAASRRAFLIYLIVLFATAVLMSIAGFWGGEMVLGH